MVDQPAMEYFLHVVLILLVVCVSEFTHTQDICKDEYCGDVTEGHYTEKYMDALHEAIDGQEDNAEFGDEAEFYEALNYLNTLASDDDIAFDKSWEFPKLHRIDPGNVGDEVQVELEPGKFYTRITKATTPPVFVIPNFLSEEECDYIIQVATNNGLNVSNLFGQEISDELSDDKKDMSDISRISEQTWLSKSELGEEMWTQLQNRVATLTEVPVYLVKSSEPIQVVSYTPGGHYHAHLDTTDDGDDRPCCIQTRCGEKELTAQWSECCRLCRFITVLYYLNDVEEGGETAFPIADMSDEVIEEKYVNLEEQEWYNLSRYCHNSSLQVTPKKGMAVMWYSHYVDDETGYLGKADRRSNHGGCDLIKGTKWIANNWISGTSFAHRYTKSLWYDQH